MTDMPTKEGLAPAFTYICVAEDGEGEPWLRGSECSACQAVILGIRLACPSCGGLDTLVEKRLGTTGSIYNCTVVYRSFPGIKTPFISAIVDIDGGGSIKGTLEDPGTFEVEKLWGAQVAVSFSQTDQIGKDGRAFVCHQFRLTGA